MTKCKTCGGTGRRRYWALPCPDCRPKVLEGPVLARRSKPMCAGDGTKFDETQPIGNQWSDCHCENCEKEVWAKEATPTDQSKQDRGTVDAEKLTVQAVKWIKGYSDLTEGAVTMTDSLAIKVIEDRLRQLAKERDEAKRLAKFWTGCVKDWRVTARNWQKRAEKAEASQHDAEGEVTALHEEIDRCHERLNKEITDGDRQTD